MTKTLLVVHHTPSPATRELLEAVLSGANDPEVVGVDVEVRPALAATVPDMLSADGYLFGTTAILGYMSDALKHYLGRYPLSTVGGVITPFLFRLLGSRNTGWFSVAIW